MHFTFLSGAWPGGQADSALAHFATDDLVLRAHGHAPPLTCAERSRQGHR